MKQRPELGDRKVVTRFALFPVKLAEGRYIWLRRYRAEVEYVMFQVADAFTEEDFLEPGWHTKSRLPY